MQPFIGTLRPRYPYNMYLARLPRCLVFMAITLPALCSAAQKTTVLHSTASQAAGLVREAPGDVALDLQQFANMQAHVTKSEKLTQASLFLVAEVEGLTAVPGSPSYMTLRVPLASTEEAYGESRTCTLAADGRPLQPIFTAGLDEPNFIAFTPALSDHTFHLLLNKYLCRALAAPFHCGGLDFQPVRDASKWRVRNLHLDLQSDAPLSLQVTSFSLQTTAKPFDYAQCAVIAPSNGLCCVQHKTTEWHCGGTPTGDGWHQVSGDCFHRETGGTCKE